MMPPPRTRRFRSILCAVDISPTSALALKYAAALAASCGGSVTAVLAVDPLLSEALPTFGQLAEHGAMADLTRFVRQSVGAAHAARMKTVVAIGRPGRIIRQQARKLHPDVIVIGTNARRGVRKVVLGSTAEAVLRTVRTPVLVIPSGVRHLPRGWPGGSIVAAVGDDLYRRSEIGAAARMAEAFGAWLSVVPISQGAETAAARRAEMIIYPLPRAGRIAMLRQGTTAYRFVCGARAPVLVIRTGRQPGVRLVAPRRAA